MLIKGTKAQQQLNQITYNKTEISALKNRKAKSQGSSYERNEIDPSKKWKKWDTWERPYLAKESAALLHSRREHGG